MMFERQQPLPLLVCSLCAGTGEKNIDLCPSCHGMGFGYESRGRFLYWGDSTTRYHIALEKGRHTLHSFEVMGSLIFGAGFLILFFWFITREDVITELFTAAFWQGELGTVPALVWLFVIVISFLAYRLLDTKKEIDIVEKNTGVALPQTQSFSSWEEIINAPKSKKKDMSRAWTLDAKKVIVDAFEVADKEGSQKVGIVHLFYALLSAPTVATVFIRLGIPPKVIQANIAKSFTHGASAEKAPAFSDDALQAIAHAYEYAYDAKQEYVHVTELLLATIRQSESLQEMLFDLSVDKDKLDNVVEWLRIRERLREQYRKFRKAAARRNKHGIDRAMTAIATPYLNNFSQDVTLSAKFNHLSPCVARDKEIDEIFRVIDGGRQSVLLVGERGVGKMSIVEGIAQLMVEDHVPIRLQDKRLVQLSTSALLAGTTVQGAQERLIRMMNEISRAGNIILCINNLHELVGGVSQAGEGLDVSGTLAEYLGTGQFLTIATTTPDGYSRTILNSEIGQTFSRVEIREMTENQAIQVLESKVGEIEYKHNVFFSYDALAQAVKLSTKFLHDQRLPESAIAIMTEAASLVRNNKGEHALVEGDHVAVIVSQKTGVPTTSISENESEKLLRLEEEMHERVVGQDEAVKMVASALRRARAEIRSQKKPISTFLFLGPTGVGKTELAKTIAEVYFGGEQAMIRIDMSEFQDKMSLYRLIGQPGQQGTGILTEAVRQKPFSLVLLDEMEKADPDILNLFLQVFDDGRLTDSVGRVIDFTNTIIIATSNAGTQYVEKELRAGVSPEVIREHLIREELRQYYRPEFLNRFDGIVLFKSLTQPEIKHIASLMLVRVGKDLETRGMALRIEDAALETLAKVGFDPDFGARPMRRAIQDRVENAIADLVLANKVQRRDTLVLGENLDIRVERG